MGVVRADEGITFSVHKESWNEAAVYNGKRFQFAVTIKSNPHNHLRNAIGNHWRKEGRRRIHLISNLALLIIVLRIIFSPMLTIILGIFTCGGGQERAEQASLLVRGSDLMGYRRVFNELFRNFGERREGTVKDHACDGRISCAIHDCRRSTHTNRTKREEGCH